MCSQTGIVISVNALEESEPEWGKSGDYAKIVEPRTYTLFI